MTEQLRDFGGHTRPELAFLSTAVCSNDCVFDLGAHIGTFAIPLARRVEPSGIVIAVEADPATFALLAANVSANGVDGIVRPLQAVLATRRSRYRAKRERKNTGATRFVQSRPWERGRPNSAALGIDQIAASWGRPDVIKIDIEGLELGVLAASATVKEARPVIYAEVSAPHLHRYGASVEAFDRFLRSLGYRMFRNVGARNAPHDEFDVIELQALADGGTFFDVLAVPTESDRVSLVTAHLK